MATLIQIRRDTQANWTTNNPVLALGELAYSTDQQKLKVGDGSSSWSTLDYINALPSEITAEINSAIDGVIDAAPGTLDTLNELAAAINDDASFYTTIADSVSSSIDALDTDAIEEGSTNLYFTDARAQSALSGLYDPAGSASSAETNANTYTDGEITTLQGTLESYADQAEADAISTAATDATTKADAAQAAAEATAAADATTKADAALASAESYADQAELDAISSANSYTDGRETAITTAYQGYADQAEADAISTAATDATSKANSAQSAAEATAAADATAKADQALVDAKAYADTAESDAVATANSYTDSEISALIGGSPELLNTLDEIAAAIADDNNFSTTVVSDIAQGLTDAKAYTDTRETAITTAYQSYADTAEADAISTAASDATTKADAAEADAITAANSYTDGRETAITTAYQSYADIAEADANTYTDNSINALDTDDVEEGTTNLYFTNVRAQDATPGRVTASATIPTSPTNGDGWLDTEDGILYIYMSDVDTSQWIQV